MDLINVLYDCIINQKTSNRTFYTYSHTLKLNNLINVVVPKKIFIINIPLFLVNYLIKLLIFFKFKFLLTFESILNISNNFDTHENIFKKITTKKTELASVIKFFRETI